MRKFRNCVATAALVAMMGVMTACGSSAKEVNPTNLANSLKSDIQYASQLVDTNDQVFFKMFGINKDNVVSQVTYNNTGDSAEVVSVIECKDANAANDVLASLKKFVSERYEMYKTYNTTEADKLNKAVTMVTGDKYVVLVVSGDSVKAKEIIEK